MPIIDPALSAILGGGITLLITKIYDFYQSTSTNKFTLEKELYLRKLHVFERSTAYLNSMHSNLTTAVLQLKALITPGTSYTIDNANNVIEHLLQKSIDEGYFSYQSLNLYVPLPDGTEENALEREAKIISGEIQHLAESNIESEVLSQKIKRFEEIAERTREIQSYKIQILKEDLNKYNLKRR